MTFWQPPGVWRQRRNDVIFPQHTRCTLYSAPHNYPVVRLK